MRLVALLVCVALPCLACTKPPSAPVTEEPSRPSEPQPALEAVARVTVFKERVAKYLAEARAGAKTLTLSPSADEVRAHVRRVHDMYHELQAVPPTVPPEIDPTPLVATRLLQIRDSFHSALLLVSQVDGRDDPQSQELRRLNQDILTPIADRIRDACAEVEAKIAAKV